MSYSIEWYGDLPEDDETMVDLGGGMVVPLRELVESAEEEQEARRVRGDRP